MEKLSASRSQYASIGVQGGSEQWEILDHDYLTMTRRFADMTKPLPYKSYGDRITEFVGWLLVIGTFLLALAGTIWIISGYAR